MFADIAPLHLMSSIAVEQAEEIYYTLLRDTLENNWNTWKVEQYLKPLVNQTHHLISEWQGMERMEQPHQFYGKLEQWGQIFK